MAQRESKRSRKIMDHLRANGSFCFKVWGSEHMMVGLPDVIGCYRGMFYALEVKHPETRGDTSARQRHVISLIKRSGGFADVVCSPGEALRKIQEAYQLFTSQHEQSG